MRETSYPHLQLAKQTGADYGVILTYADALTKSEVPLNKHEERPLFDLMLYGVGKEFYYVATGPSSPGSRPIGGEFVTEALRRRGLDPVKFWTSFWFAREMRQC